MMILIHHLFLMVIVFHIVLKKTIFVLMQDEVSFVVGDVRLKDNDISYEDTVNALRAIEKLMLEYGIIKMDVCMNPFQLPDYVKKL